MLLRPLAASRVEQRRFVDRAAETEAVVRAVRASRPVLLLGEPGSGRTSMLNHVAWLLSREPEPRDSIVLSGEVARDPAQLLGVLIARVQRLAGPDRSPGAWLEDLRALSMPDGPFGDVAQPAILMELVDLLGERFADLGRPVCLMIDGVAPSVAHGVFGTLRNELWALDGPSWVVAGDAAAGPLYREPPADAFFEQVVELPPLADADAAKLLRAHAPELTDDQIEQAVAVGRGNPRRLLRAAGEIQAGIAPTEDAGDALAEQATELAGPLAGSLIRYLAAHGPAPASDRALLRRLGTSRQRASQLMHRLEDAGLLQTLGHHEPGKRGRPTRRFAIKGPS